MTSELNTQITQLLRDHKDRRVAIAELFRMQSAQQDQTCLVVIRKTILFLMESEHDWRNILHYVQRWNMTDFTASLISRMRNRVGENPQAYKGSDPQGELKRLFDKYWMLVSPKRKEQIYEQAEEQITKKEKPTGRLTLNPSNDEVKKEEAKQPLKFILRQSKSSDEEDSKSSSKGSRKSSIQSTANNVVKLLSKLTKTGSIAEKRIKKVEHPPETNKQGPVSPKANPNQYLDVNNPINQFKSNESKLETGRKQSKAEIRVQSGKKSTDTEYPQLKNLQSRRKVNMSPIRSIDPKALRIKKEKVDPVQPPILTNPMNDFSFTIPSDPYNFSSHKKSNEKQQRDQMYEKNLEKKSQELFQHVKKSSRGSKKISSPKRSNSPNLLSEHQMRLIDINLEKRNYFGEAERRLKVNPFSVFMKVMGR